MSHHVVFIAVVLLRVDYCNLRCYLIVGVVHDSIRGDATVFKNCTNMYKYKPRAVVPYTRSACGGRAFVSVKFVRLSTPAICGFSELRGLRAKSIPVNVL